MKKIVIVVFLLSTILMLISIELYSSTSNAVINRLQNLNIPLSQEQSGQNDEEADNFDSESITTSKSVYEEAYEFYTPITSVSSPYQQYSDRDFSEEPDKVVYLTIDDGPDPKSTPEYLDVLRQQGVKATFFMTGWSMENNPELVRSIDLEGHAIGNHSYSHNYSRLYKNADNFDEEINKTEGIIYSIIGKRVKIFRPPGGSPNMHKSEFIDKLDQLGYTFFDWNVTAADTSPGRVTKKQVIDNIKRGSKKLDKVIVLMHDNHKRRASLEALPEVITWFKEKGYVFGTLNENIKPVHLIKVKKKINVQ